MVHIMCTLIACRELNRYRVKVPGSPKSTFGGTGKSLSYVGSCSWGLR